MLAWLRNAFVEVRWVLGVIFWVIAGILFLSPEIFFITCLIHEAID